ncbi:MAG: hypothetical protein KJ749_01885 [Planctomycetes bacterium]|nr:hypothetical protein [Planctomycetota bacterium]
MSADSTTGDQKRFRHALTVVIAGLVLIIWAWASWVIRESATKEVPAMVAPDPADTTSLPD